MATSPFIANAILVPVIFILGTGIANPLKNIIPNFWIGPIALMLPACALYTLYPSNNSAGRILPLLLILSSVFYIIMTIADILFIDTSFMPYFIRRGEFMVVVVAFVILLRNASDGVALRTLQVSIVGGMAFIVADYFIPALSNALNSIMFVERFGYLGTHRAMGLFINPNAAGAFLSFAAAVCARGAKRPLRIFFYIVALIGILATVSRGSLILWAMAVLLTELIIVKDMKITVNLVPIISGGLLLLAIFAIAQNTTIDSLRFLNLSNDTATRLTTLGDASATERTELMRYAWSQFLAKPIFGMGIGHDYNWAPGLPVHNTYLQMLVEHGVIGLLWFFLFVFALTKAPAPFNVIAPMLLLVKGIFNHSLFNEINDAMIIAMFATGAGWVAAELPKSLTRAGGVSITGKPVRRYGPAPRPNTAPQGEQS
jgi:O-antigen ligase